MTRLYAVMTQLCSYKHTYKVMIHLLLVMPHLCVVTIDTPK